MHTQHHNGEVSTGMHAHRMGCGTRGLSTWARDGTGVQAMARPVAVAASSRPRWDSLDMAVHPAVEAVETAVAMEMESRWGVEVGGVLNPPHHRLLWDPRGRAAEPIRMPPSRAARSTCCSAPSRASRGSPAPSDASSAATHPPFSFSLCGWWSSSPCHDFCHVHPTAWPHHLLADSFRQMYMMPKRFRAEVLLYEYRLLEYRYRCRYRCG